MNEDRKYEFRSYLKYYWGTWLFLMVGLLALRIYIFNNVKEPFGLFSIYFFCSWMPLGFVNLIEYYRIIDYLEKNQKDTWAYVTSSWLMGGPGSYNYGRYFDFIMSRNHLNDPVVKKMKSNQIGIYLLMLTIFITIPILFIYVMTYNL